MDASLEGAAMEMLEDLSGRVMLVEEDRALDGDLRLLLDDIRDQRWSLYAE